MLATRFLLKGTVVALALACGPVEAATVYGTLTDANGRPLKATVEVKCGTDWAGSTTDPDGKYSVSLRLSNQTCKLTVTSGTDSASADVRLGNQPNRYNFKMPKESGQPLEAR